MNLENSNGNSYASNSGNTYTYTYITNNFDHAFNNTNSHNGHGRGGCSVVGALLLAAIPIIVSVIACNMIGRWLT